jgi:hypothetical protein
MHDDSTRDQAFAAPGWHEDSQQYRPTRADMPIPFALRLDYDADFLPDGSIVERDSRAVIVAAAPPTDSRRNQLVRAARLAYRLGRQDQQRLLERALRRRFSSDVQARTLADLAEGMTDDLVDFHAIIRAAQLDTGAA